MTDECVSGHLVNVAPEHHPNKKMIVHGSPEINSSVSKIRKSSQEKVSQISYSCFKSCIASISHGKYATALIENYWENSEYDIVFNKHMPTTCHGLV